MGRVCFRLTLGIQNDHSFMGLGPRIGVMWHEANGGLCEVERAYISA